MHQRRLGVGLLIVAALAMPTCAAPAYAQSAGLEAVAGTGAAGSSGDGGPATDAQLDGPSGIAVAGDGTVYISDTRNHTVRAVSPDGTISMVAGTGRLAATTQLRDGTAARLVDLASPADLAIGADRSVYIADTGLYRVLRLSTDGRISVVAGNGRPGYAGDGGRAVDAELGQPAGLAVGPDGTLYIADPSNARVRAVNSAGTITTVAGNGHTRLEAAGGTATAVAVPGVTNLTVDADGTMWLVDATYLQQIRNGRLLTITEPGQPAGNRWGISDAATWPPPASPLQVTGVVSHDRDVYLQTGATLLRLAADHRTQITAVLGLHLFHSAAATATAVYLVDESNNQVFRVHPSTPPPSSSAPGRSTRGWLYVVVAGIAVLLVAVLILRRRRTQRRART